MTQCTRCGHTLWLRQVGRDTHTGEPIMHWCSRQDDKPVRLACPAYAEYVYHQPGTTGGGSMDFLATPLADE